jgi:hypothetical protein
LALLRNSLVSAGHENPAEVWRKTFDKLSEGDPDKIAAYTDEATPDNVFKVSPAAIVGVHAIRIYKSVRPNSFTYPTL